MVRRDRRLLLVTVTSVLLMLGAAGCDEDERLARFAEEATQRQAAQNEEIARVARESAQAAQRLVEADAQARQEMVQLQHDMQTHQAKQQRETLATQALIGRERDKLENERRQIAQQRQWDSTVASAISGAALLLACLLPLAVALYVLRAARTETASEAELAELLTQELIAGDSLLFPPHHVPGLAIEQRRLRAIPCGHWQAGPDEPADGVDESAPAQ